MLAYAVSLLLALFPHISIKKFAAVAQNVMEFVNVPKVSLTCEENVVNLSI
jgi:hypothetical protein